MVHSRKLLVIVASLVMVISIAVPAAAYAPAKDGIGRAASPGSDNLPNPLGDAQFADRQQALQAVLQGKATPVGPNAVVEIESSTVSAEGNVVRSRKFVELAREDEDTIWTVLGEFGTQVHPAYVDFGSDPGPLHNQIPKPNRKVDNTSIWTADFNVPYYDEMLFSEAPGAVSMRNYYIEQSSNRYTVNGTIEDWVPVPYNAPRYGSNVCGDIVCTNVWRFVQDSTNSWYSKMTATMTPAQIEAYLAPFDVWDRYDYNGNGIFDEPDGYIDHFQSVHAGSGEETGGGAQGENAIWSHRWYVQLTPIGAGGPTVGGTVVPFGGTRIGNSSKWIGDYTIEPEDGGVGVFAHEFGHDLGLPDLYDTSGNTGGAENSTGFWTLYSSGSYGSTGKPKDGIGSKPIPMSAYEKIFLGWSNYALVLPGQQAEIKLGPSFFNTQWAQHIVALLPDKAVETSLGAPYAGDWQYFSGAGNDLDNSMTRSMTLPAGAVSFAAKVKFDIELDWDYAYLTVDGTPVHTNLSTNTDPNLQNFGEGITGDTDGAWVDLTADLSAFAGGAHTIGFRYWTDVAVAEAGFFADDIAITGQPVDGAETEPGWTYVGFSRVGSTVTQSFFNAYFVENRVYGGYDKGLKTGPYNFGFLDNPSLQNWVEHFPYQDGMLVWYYDESFADNSVGDHCAAGRCGGLVLPVDAHPNLLLRPDNGQMWRPRVQSFDSTFGTESTDPICLHANSVRGCYPSLRANPKFDDSLSYWVAPNPAIGNLGWSSVIVPNTGTTIRTDGSNGSYMNVFVNK